MNFTSFHFLAFFAVSLVLGHFLKNRAQRIFLLVASYYFYGVFEPTYLILILVSTLIDYLGALGIEGSRERERGLSPTGLMGTMSFLSPRQWVSISLCMNISLLGYFKYTNFGIEILNDISPFGATVFAWPAANILLPVGISFYTFQSMSYTVDVFRGTLPARRNFVDFALYVAFFPQLVAGPIVRATTFFHRLDERIEITKNDIVVGMTRIVVGFFRKLVLSDNLGALTNAVFGNPMAYSPLDVWLASVGFCFQIYLDFAGYTDIARGVARLFGFEFEVNFLYPMAATSPTDHWTRWHISLTTWMRDYVYIPLGGSRVGPVRLHFNMFVVWFIVGLWHGPAYHFVAWGVWQFVLIAVHRLYRNGSLGQRMAELRGMPAALYSLVCWALTMFFLNFGFIWFRAETMTKSALMHGREFGLYDLPAALREGWAWLFGTGTWAKVSAALHGPDNWVMPASVFQPYVFLLALYYLYDFVMNKYQLEYFWKEENRWKLNFMVVGMLLCILIFANPDAPSFLYFQF